MSDNKHSNTVLVSRIVKSSLDKFNNLPKTGKPVNQKEWTVLSTITQYDSKMDIVRVVSLGTGTKCLTNKDLEDNGIKLNDSHAEVMARRGFMRYLLDQIQNCMEQDATIFENQLNSSKFILKPNISFHFFTTHPPCGDASISEHSELGPPETKKAKLEINPQKQEESSFTGARLLSTDYVDTMAQVIGCIRTKPGRGIRTSSVSCSDKLLRWNLVGVQGALLSTLLSAPIYFNTFTLIGHSIETSLHALKRALFERLEDKINFIKAPFKVNALDIYVIPSTTFNFSKSDDLNPSPNSIVWCDCKERPFEVAVNGKRLGATKKDQGSKSRLYISKIELFRRYLKIKDQKFNQNNTKNSTYLEAKSAAKDYQEQWNCLLKNCIKIWTQKPESHKNFKVE